MRNEYGFEIYAPDILSRRGRKLRFPVPCGQLGTDRVPAGNLSFVTAHWLVAKNTLIRIKGLYSLAF